VAAVGGVVGYHVKLSVMSRSNMTVYVMDALPPPTS
jgi:hypothetical protein